MKFDLINMEIQRKELIDIIESQGISDIDVLKAIQNTPREFFAGQKNLNSAYENCALPIGYGQTISQPYTVAFMTELLDIDKFCNVLEIGTGSGYQTYILSLLAKEVFTVERITELHIRTKALFESIEVTNVNFKLADGTLGWDLYSKFDRIIVTAASFDVPQSLIYQLKIGGILVMPVGDKKSQTMYKITKISTTQTNTEQFDKFSFVPLIGNQAWGEEM